MAGKKTSIYLSEDLAERVDASGLLIPELIRRGLAADDPEPEDAATRRMLREELDAMRSDLEESLTRTVTRALDNAMEQRRYG